MSINAGAPNRQIYVKQEFGRSLGLGGTMHLGWARTARPVSYGKERRKHENPHCLGKIALDNGEVDFKYHRCHEGLLQTCRKYGMNTEEMADVLGRNEWEVVIILADIIYREMDSADKQATKRAEYLRRKERTIRG